MAKVNFCAECGAKTGECECLQGKSKQKSKFGCKVLHYGQPCNSTENLINVGTPDHPTHWCLKHYRERSKPDPIQAEIERRAKLFADEAKKQGISNYEFFK